MAQVDPAVAGQHGHSATFRAACVLVHGFALSAEEAWPFALDYNSRCMPPWSERDLKRKLNEAVTHPKYDKPRGYLLSDQAMPREARLVTSPPKPTYQPEKLARVASNINEKITREYLGSRSKVSPSNRTPARFLEYISRPGEHVLIFTVYESQGCNVWTHSGSSGRLSSLCKYQRGFQNVWFLANPCDGQFGSIERLKSPTNPVGRSRRAQENITSFRYAVLESDVAPSDQWLRALVQMRLPIAAIYDSGGKSVHALVRIDAASKEDWDARVRLKMMPALVPFGADPSALTAVRLTRLPNCMREETGKLQRLLYLDPEPDGVPICQKPACFQRKPLPYESSPTCGSRVDAVCT
jgi:hypothetical protein